MLHVVLLNHILNRFTWFDISSNGNSSSRNYLNWIPKYTKQLGLCYSYLIPDYLHAAEVRQVSIYIRKSLDIYLHHPGQFLSWQIYGFPIRLNQEGYVETSHEVHMV